MHGTMKLRKTLFLLGGLGLSIIFIVACGSSEASLAQSVASSEKVVEQPLTPDEWFLFFPTTYPDGNWQPQGLKFEDVWFEAEDGTQLHAWYFAHPNPKQVILYAHGNGGHLAHRASLMQYLIERLDVSIMIFDYRGYGRSEGIPTVVGVLQDARAARSKLSTIADLPESDIILMGRSLGGAVVADLTRSVAPRALILESTFSSFKDIAAVAAPSLAWLVPKEKLNSLSALAAYSGPLLQSHGNRDQTIPFALGKKLFDAAAGPKKFMVIDGGGHNGHQGWEYYAELNRFIEALDTSSVQPNKE